MKWHSKNSWNGTSRYELNSVLGRIAKEKRLLENCSSGNCVETSCEWKLSIVMGYSWELLCRLGRLVFDGDTHLRQIHASCSIGDVGIETPTRVRIVVEIYEVVHLQETILISAGVCSIGNWIYCGWTRR